MFTDTTLILTLSSLTRLYGLAFSVSRETAHNLALITDAEVPSHSIDS